MKRIYLIDCPGVVPPNSNDSEEDILLRGVVRVENVEHPEQYVAGLMKKVKPHHLERTYEVRGYKNPTEFLEILARKGGRLLRGGEADVDGVAKMVLNDFLRGKIPWFTPPPDYQADRGQATNGIEDRNGRLGEMGRKRKRDSDEPVEAASDDEGSSDEDGSEDFEGLGFEDDDEDGEQDEDEEDSDAEVSVDGLESGDLAA